MRMEAGDVKYVGNLQRQDNKCNIMLRQSISKEYRFPVTYAENYSGQEAHFLIIS